MVEEAVEHLVRGIVEHPDDVAVRTKSLRAQPGRPSGGVVEVRVHPEDLGRVIGRGGRTATALRSVVEALVGRRTRVDFVDPVRSR